ERSIRPSTSSTKPSSTPSGTPAPRGGIGSCSTCAAFSTASLSAGMPRMRIRRIVTTGSPTPCRNHSPIWTPAFFPPTRRGGARAACSAWTASTPRYPATVSSPPRCWTFSPSVACHRLPSTSRGCGARTRSTTTHPRSWTRCSDWSPRSSPDWSPLASPTPDPFSPRSNARHRAVPRGSAAGRQLGDDHHEVVHVGDVHAAVDRAVPGAYEPADDGVLAAPAQCLKLHRRVLQVDLARHGWLVGGDVHLAKGQP